MTARYVVAVIGGDAASTTLIAVGLMVIPIAVTSFGVRFAASVQLVLSAALVAVLVFVLAVAAPHGQPAHLQPLLPHGWGGVGLAMSLYIWAFAGWEAVAGIGGEFRNPRRDIPRATALALVIVSVAYLAIQTVTVLVLGDRAASSAVPLLELVEVGHGTGRRGRGRRHRGDRRHRRVQRLPGGLQQARRGDGPRRRPARLVRPRSRERRRRPPWSAALDGGDGAATRSSSWRAATCSRSSSSRRASRPRSTGSASPRRCGCCPRGRSAGGWRCCRASSPPVS